MSLLGGETRSRLIALMILGLLLADGLLFVLPVEPVWADPPLTWKWTSTLGTLGKTFLGPLAADLNNDGKMEIVVVGGSSDGGTDGTVTVLNGTTGIKIWQVAPYSKQEMKIGIGMHSPFEIADLNKDGIPEIIIAGGGASYGTGTLALHGNNGSMYWKNAATPAEENYLAVGDVDGDGYPEIFVSRGNGPINGHDWITQLSYDGKILRQAWAWRPCWGGMALGDTNFDGILELYAGDRSQIYALPGERYKGGGMGPRALDARTLTHLWNDPTVGSSSTTPILGDVDKDGILDVIVENPGGTGIAVYNSADGSVVTTGGIYRKGNTNMKGHSQPTVYDIDGDGNLEMIANNVSQPKIWDLYDWKLDATLPIFAWEPPKVGDVTGDGQMDIIAVNGSNIYIYTYDKTSSTYTSVQNITAPASLLSAFTLVQDIDGDGKNELVFTSSTGKVVAYDTPAPAPTPRARTVNHFYSERRLGAAEYVPSPVSRALFTAPTQGDPQLVSSRGTNGTDENLIARNQSTSDLDGDSVTNIYRWSVNDVSFTNLQMPFDTRATRVDPLFSEGFEYNFDRWDENGATDWDRSATQKHSGLYSAHAGGLDNYLISDDLNASSASSITVSFWYRDHGVDNDDDVYLQFWNGTTYRNIFELGNTGPEDTWHYYQVWYRTFFWYRISDFHIRFDGRSIDSGEELWIDDVSITLGDASVTKDYSSYDNHGTVYGAGWTNRGVVGGAYFFDGSDFMVVEDSPSLGQDGSWTEISVEYWVRLSADQRGSRILAAKAPGPPDPRYMTGFKTDDQYLWNTLHWGLTIKDPSKPNKYDFIQTWSNPGTVLSANAWYHVVCTYESGVGLGLYINGTLRSSTVASGSIRGLAGERVYVGYDGDGGSSRYLQGWLDEVRIYPRALTPEQVMQRFAESRGGSSVSSTMVAEETEVGEVWKSEVTPSDSFLDGAAKTSNTLTVLPPHVNNPPVITSFEPLTDPTIVEGEQQQFGITYSDPDSDATTVQWYVNGTPSGNTAAYTFTSSLGMGGKTYNVTVQVTDVHGASASHEWKLSVLFANRPPQIDSYSPADSAVQVNEGGSQEFTHTSSDPDGDVLFYSWFLNSSLQSSSQNWTFVPDYWAAGPWNVTLVVSDGGLWVSQQWIVTVVNVNLAPVIDSYFPSGNPGSPVIFEGEFQEFNVTYHDPDGDSTMVQWFVDDSATVTTDFYVFLAGFDSAGVYNVTVVVSDGLGGVAVHEWDLTVLDVNRAPTIDTYSPADASVQVTLGESVSFNHTSSDPDGDSLTYLWLLDSVVQAASQNWTFVAAGTGVYNVTLAVSDVGGLHDTQQWQVTVPAENAYLVIRGPDGNVHYRLYNGTSGLWDDWHVVSDVSTLGSPAAALYSGKLYIVSRGLDGQTIWFGSVNLTDYSFSGWTKLSGETESAPTLVRYGSSLVLVVRGLNNWIYYRLYDSISDTWGSWKYLPAGSTIDTPAAAVLGDRLHVVVRGDDGYTIWHSYVNMTNDEFSGWQFVGGSTLSRPVLAASESGSELYLVVVGLDGRIYHNFWGGSVWSGWVALPDGSTGDGPAAVVMNNKLNFVVRGSEGTTLWYGYIDLDTSGFSGWSSVGSSTNSAPTLVRW